MLKKSLLVSIFVLLFIGLSDYGYACHKGGNDPKGCEGGDGDSGNNQTPVIVTFDGWENDSIQSDGEPYVDGEDVQAIIPDVFDSPGQFVMNLKLGGLRNLFIDFGAAVDCDTGAPDMDGDCVEDAREQDVECPFPLVDADGNRFRRAQDGTATNSCSALVKAFLAERTAFTLGANGVMENIEYILDMDPRDPGPNGGGPVKKVRSVTHGEWDIVFKVPRPNGNKLTSWYFTFSNLPSGHCDPEMEPQFLSIRALNLSSDLNVGGARGADTWEIGTFDGDGYDDSRLACLSKAKGGNPDEFVGFFEMNFMYTIEIK